MRHYEMTVGALLMVERMLEFTFHSGYRLDRRYNGGALTWGATGQLVKLKSSTARHPIAFVDEPMAVTKSMADTACIQFMTRGGLETKSTLIARDAFVEELMVFSVQHGGAPVQDSQFVPYVSAAIAPNLDVMVDGSRVFLLGDFSSRPESNGGHRGVDAFGRYVVDDSCDLDALSNLGIANLSDAHRHAYAQLAPLRAGR